MLNISQCNLPKKGVMMALVTVLLSSVSVSGFSFSNSHVPLKITKTLQELTSTGLQQNNRRGTKMALFGVTPARSLTLDVREKYFQLEEMEDKEKCVTEIYFNPDHTLRLTDTDGPEPKEARGEWHCTEDGSGIRFRIIRTFGGGQPQTMATDMGEFDFKVGREYHGLMEKVGGLVAFSGSIHRILGEDEDEETEVGYFELIDTTMSRLEDEGRIEHFKKQSLGGI